VREFWQLNADIFGLNGVEADIEIITLADAIMRDFGAKPSDYTIRISSRKLMSAIFNNWYELDESKSKAMQTLIDKKAKLPEDVFEEEAEKIVGKAFCISQP
jgi:histidyl-tRNA synthetase